MWRKLVDRDKDIVGDGVNYIRYCASVLIDFVSSLKGWNGQTQFFTVGNGLW